MLFEDVQIRNTRQRMKIPDKWIIAVWGTFEITILSLSKLNLNLKSGSIPNGLYINEVWTHVLKFSKYEILVLRALKFLHSIFQNKKLYSLVENSNNLYSFKLLKLNISKIFGGKWKREQRGVYMFGVCDHIKIWLLKIHV